MRKITQQAVNAFYAEQKFSQGNTSVIDGAMYLHGNKIAFYKDNVLHISFCGWQTTTTKERINGVLQNGFIFQKKGKLYFGRIGGKKTIEIDAYKTYNVRELCNMASNS